MCVHIHNHIWLPLVCPPPTQSLCVTSTHKHTITLCDFWLPSAYTRTQYVRIYVHKNLTTDTSNLMPSTFTVCCCLVVFFTHCNLGASDLRGMVVFMFCFVRHETFVGPSLSHVYWQVFTGIDFYFLESNWWFFYLQVVLMFSAAPLSVKLIF